MFPLAEDIRMLAQSVTAVFRKGILQPLRPLNLHENERVELSIIRIEEKNGPTIDLSGIWQGLGDPSYEEIESITHGQHHASIERLLSHLNGDDQ